LRSNAELNEMVMGEITDALNTMRIPEYVRVGRPVLLY
jgi:hypothetical protein